MQLDECAPDSRMFSQVLKSLGKHGEVIEVMDLLEVMRSAGFLPDPLEAIDVPVRAGKGDYAYSILTKIQRVQGKIYPVLTVSLMDFSLKMTLSKLMSCLMKF